MDSVVAVIGAVSYDGVNFRILPMVSEYCGMTFKKPRTVIRSKNMLQIIKNALNTVRLDPDHGELMYQILYLTYFSERKLANREAILAELERIGFQMSMVTYHSYLNMAIKAIDRILWGYTARDCMEIIKQFLP